MPFKSKAQQKMAFAKGKPWAEEWADKTDQSKLPARKGKKAAGGKAKSQRRS
ncbi:hypothetical protein ACLGIH_20275 [Streptomyces sp. HMX87]|uniref:hypothetical protein n=1 Tax=Streptomyces sp. HMX87 TaxID=3390849 RepID=UPI003A86C6C2